MARKLTDPFGVNQKPLQNSCGITFHTGAHLFCPLFEILPATTRAYFTSHLLLPHYHPSLPIHFTVLYLPPSIPPPPVYQHYTISQNHQSLQTPFHLPQNFPAIYIPALNNTESLFPVPSQFSCSIHLSSSTLHAIICFQHRYTQIRPHKDEPVSPFVPAPKPAGEGFPTPGFPFQTTSVPVSREGSLLRRRALCTHRWRRLVPELEAGA